MAAVTLEVAGVLLGVIGVVDAALGGFRGSVGRDGRIRHLADDVRYAGRGLVIMIVALLPVIIGVTADVVVAGRTERWAVAGTGMLTVYLPYAVVVLGGLVAYLLLPWRQRFWATALILGPFTLARPVVAVAGGIAAGWAYPDPAVWAAAAWSVAAASVVDPTAGWWWRHREGRPGPDAFEAEASAH